MLLAATLSLAIWIYLLLGHGRFWQAGPALAATVPATAPSLAIIVPARDEAASIARSLRSLLAQTYPGPWRIILVDDCSQDGTAEIAAGLADPPPDNHSRRRTPPSAGAASSGPCSKASWPPAPPTSCCSPTPTSSTIPPTPPRWPPTPRRTAWTSSAKWSR